MILQLLSDNSQRFFAMYEEVTKEEDRILQLRKELAEAIQNDNERLKDIIQAHKRAQTMVMPSRKRPKSS